MSAIFQPLLPRKAYLSFLIDKTVLDVSGGTAIAISVGTLLVAWLGYEALCRSPLGRHEATLALIGYVFLVALTYGFTHLFSGRGAKVPMAAQTLSRENDREDAENYDQRRDCGENDTTSSQASSRARVPDTMACGARLRISFLAIA